MPFTLLPWTKPTFSNIEMFLSQVIFSLCLPICTEGKPGRAYDWLRWSIRWLIFRRSRDNFFQRYSLSTTFFFNKFILFIYLFIFWLCWVFISVQGLSPVVASRGHSSSRCAGLSLSRPLLLRSTGSRRAGSVVVAHGPSCSAACGIFLDQGSNQCPLH